MGEFSRDNQSMYNIPQSFADQKLKRCPFCEVEKPAWLVKEEWKLLGKNYYFKCPHCGSILRVPQDDVTGLSYTATSFAGQLKKHKGKENRKIYIKIEKIAVSVRTQENIPLEGAEVTLEELNHLIEKGELQR